ncbi:hypothetical protein PtB15_2B120 [Puccinia triticina]|nr:hypothetical protein PtB15_2B120 [Puccinia triticina]
MPQHTERATPIQQMTHLIQAQNVIFTGKKMLTTPKSGWDEDISMFSCWGITPLGSFASYKNQDTSLKAETVENSHASTQPSAVQIT